MVSPTGAKSWALRTRIGGKSAKLTLGSASTFTLAQARAWAREQLLDVKAGSDPRAVRREREAAERRKHEATVAAAVELWLAKDQAPNRTVAEVRAAMAKWVLPAWGDRLLSSIRKRDVIELVDKVAVKAPVRANRVLAYVKRFLGWCAARDMIDASPAAAVEKVTRETKRDRVLDDAELVTVWRAAEAMGGIFGMAVRLLVLTAARRAEIFEARRSELLEHGTALRLPAERSKSGQGRIIWLPELAQRIVVALPDYGPESFLFSFSGTNAYTAWSGGKQRLDAAAARIAGGPLPNWRLHDLRRTAATGLQRLGERLEVVETVLGHVAGSRAGIVGTYQKHRFEQEAKAALDRWSRHVAGLLDPEPDKVVELAQRTA